MQKVGQIWLQFNTLIPAIFLKAVEGMGKLTAEEKVRWGAMLLMAFRRLEVAFLQLKHGATTHDLIPGLERSLLLMLATKGGSEWWKSAKQVFNDKFVNHIEESLRFSEYVDPKPVQFNIGE